MADALPQSGLLVFGAGNGPARVAELVGGGKVQARVLHAEVVRVSNGCLLLQGQEDGYAQAWLCAQDERAGNAAVTEDKAADGRGHAVRGTL